MKTSLLFLLAFPAFGQFSFSMPVSAIIHPVRTFHAIPASEQGLLVTDIFLQDANAIDAITTYKGPILHPGQYCENNPVLVSSRCVISTPRFDALKYGTLAAGIIQWIPIWLGHRNQTYIRTMTILNAAYGTSQTVSDIGNIRALTK